MCSGRVDMAFVLRALEQGADGVVIGGCKLGECHYVTEGNYHALNTAHLLKKLLQRAGLNPNRLRVEWISSSEGVRFAQIMNDFAAELREMGPRGEGEGLAEEELRSRLAEIRNLVPYIKIAKREKLALRFDTEEEFEELYTTEEVEEIFTDLPSYYIDPEKCQGCMICGRKCPVHGIIGGKNLIHVIDQETCIKCGTCFEACPEKFGAVRPISGEPVPDPIPEEERILVRAQKSAG